MHRRTLLALLATKASTNSQTFPSSQDRSTDQGEDELLSYKVPLPEPSIIDTLSQQHDLRSAKEHRPAQREYSKAGYDFVRDVADGGGFFLNRVRLSVVTWAVLACAAAAYLLYYFTTRTYTLTTDRSPYKNTLFQKFPCDYAIIENKGTRSRRVVDVSVSYPSSAKDKEEAQGTLSTAGAEVQEAGALAVTTPIAEQTFHVNYLIDRVLLYLQKTRVSVIVDTHDVLHPHRFIKVAETGGRVNIAARRVDQLLPDADDAAASTLPLHTNTAGTTQPKRDKLLFLSTVRPLRIRNGYQQGPVLAYKQTTNTVVRELLCERYKQLIFDKYAPGVHRVYANEMLENGSITGEGITLSEVVPDVKQFEEEVLHEVTRRMGDGILLYEHVMRVY